MATTTLHPNQTILDMAIDATGTIESIIGILYHNNCSITADVAANTQFTIPDNTPTDEAILATVAAAKVRIGNKADL